MRQAEQERLVPHQGQGRDALSRRIAVLRGQEDEKEPEAWGLRELNVEAVQRLFPAYSSRSRG
jgi:hypothetical protein